MSLRIGMYHCRLPEPGRKPGGVEVFVDRLAGALVRRGHDVTVHTFADRVEPRPYRVSTLRPAWLAASPIGRQYLGPWMLNLRPSTPVDVFHFHGDDWFCFRRRWPTVRTFYGSALLEALTATSLKRRIDQGIIFALEQLAAGLADARYGIGSDSRVLYRADGVLQLGVEVPHQAAAPHPSPVILFIGTWRGRKRGAELHRIFQEHVLPRVPTAQLWMVSDECEPGPGVTWHARPSDGEIQALMRAAWTFCLPSSYEGFGIPYLDALAAGVPVVATPNPGAEDLMSGGRGGLIVELDAVGDALVLLLQDVDRRRALVEAGRARAAEFDWDIIGERYENAYALAIDRWRRR